MVKFSQGQPKARPTGQTDREAHAYSALVPLAPREQYFAAMGPDSPAPLSKLNDKYKYCKKISEETLAFVFYSGRMLGW